MGSPVNSHVIRLVITAYLIDYPNAEAIHNLKLSQQWISNWARSVMGWTWRARTTAASKLPNDWEEQGIKMAKRLAAAMQMYSVHSLSSN